MNGAYADVEFDKQQRRIKATITWNPRRMLRDQLVLEGYHFEDNEPLPPFSKIEYWKYMSIYTKEVLFERNFDKSNLNRAELKDTMPRDIYGLFVNSGQTTRVPFGSAVRGEMRDLLVASHFGYSAIVKLVIDRTFEKGISSKVNSIRDINRPDIEDLYLSEKWFVRR